MKGWKTLVFNGAVGLIVILKELLTFTAGVNWADFLPPQTAELVIVVIGIANILLRHVTTGPAGWKKV